MLKRVVFAAGLLALVSAPLSASVLTLTDTIGNPAAVTVAPGGTFQVVVTLTTDTPSTGYSYFIQASQGNIFNVATRAVDVNNPFTDPTTANSGITGLLNTTSVDLGGGKADVSTDSPAGTYLSTLTFAVAAGAPTGTYNLITTTDSCTVDTSFNVVYLPASTPYVVTVAVPEPTALAFIGVAGMMLIRRKPR